jgi:N-formylglutamate amidohydrolase
MTKSIKKERLILDLTKYIEDEIWRTYSDKLNARIESLKQEFDYEVSMRSKIVAQKITEELCKRKKL